MRFSVPNLGLQPGKAVESETRTNTVTPRRFPLQPTPYPLLSQISPYLQTPKPEKF